MDIHEWNGIIDAYIAKENEKTGKTYPSYRLFDSRAVKEKVRGVGLYNTYVTEDLIGRYARALGDPNPLYTDPVYAADSACGGIVAPPVFECCILSPFMMGSMPKVKGFSFMDGGMIWERRRHIRPGDRFTARVVYLGVTESSKPDQPYRLLFQKHRFDLLDQHEAVVSELTHTSILKCNKPDAPRPEKKVKEAQAEQPYDQETLQAVYDNMKAQLEGAFIRGAKPRLWEDVQIGDSLPEIMVGPYDDADARSFMGGAIGVSNAFATKWGAIQNQLFRAPVDAQTGAHRLPLDWHFSDHVAQALGQPHALVSGMHSQALLGYAAGSWMGDHGFLKRLSCKNSKAAYFGDILTTTGTVVDKYMDNGEKLVKLRLESRRQNGIVHTEGEALVRLP